VRQIASYKNFRPSSETASRTKAKNRAADTKCEVILRGVLWRRGFRFRKNFKGLPGKPDIVFPRERVAVFVDGDFWHGRNWDERKRKLAAGSNSAYWVAKIETNMARDKRYDAALDQLGWKVLRVWETDVLADPESSADSVSALVLLERHKDVGAGQ
jgi:DNA mismatch endonuclease (patch repair protein)